MVMIFKLIHNETSESLAICKFKEKLSAMLKADIVGLSLLG